jgi:riboflavin transporter FmnP
MKKTDTKKLTTLAMLAAMAYIVVFICHFIMPPIVETPSLKLDFKDMVITMSGFMFGPLSAFFVTIVVSLIEMLTISSSGIIGFIMNVVASCAFACTSAFLYKKIHSKKGAIISLFAGVIIMTIVMILWNYIVTPLYYGMPRSAVVPLLPAISAFNLLKGGLNMALTLLIYKPLVTALRKSGLMRKSESSTNAGDGKGGFKPSLGMYIFAGALLVTCVLLALALAGVI